MSKRRIVALEEHYHDPEVLELLGISATGPLGEKLKDFTTVRLREMDEAGIDVQVISHAPPALQRIDAAHAPDLAERVNNRLYEAVQANSARFAAFASLPTTDPEAAAAELERTVKHLGFKGAMIHGLTGNLFIDDKQFWPIFSQAQRLDVPIYIHPADPHPAVQNAYFGHYATTHPMFLRAAWGFTIETGTQAMRLVLSGVLDAYPRLKIILGHFGEAIPFLLARIDEALARDTPMKNFRQYFCKHFYVTTSGFFSDPALLCCVQEMGIDRILFSVDWPYASNRAGTHWIDRVPLAEADKRKICYENAQKLLRLP
jgi:predicted TIM-barrel fold metal-dependent hydrolase